MRNSVWTFQTLLDHEVTSCFCSTCRSRGAFNFLSRFCHNSPQSRVRQSALWYRRGHVVREFILNHPVPFPRDYVADGEYDSDCTTLRQHAEGPGAAKLQFCEDATFWEHHNVVGIVVERPVILSCDAGRRKWNTVMGPLQDPEPRGSLWLYVPEFPLTDTPALPSRLSRNRVHPIVLANYPPKHDFHPLGAAIWPSYGGNSSNLFVVNHARQRTVIEHFVLSPDKPTEAVHKKTITSPYFLSPNALALTSPTSFYVTNDHLMTRRLPGLFGHILPVIETIFALPLAFVLHVTLNDIASSREFTVSVQFAKMFTSFPNGIALSPSGNEVAIASTPMAQVGIFRRDPVTNVLTHKDTVPVPFWADNVHYKKEHNGPASLIVAGHPNPRAVIKVATGQAGAVANSWVVSVVPKQGDQKSQTTFDSDAPISASTRVKEDGVTWTLKTLFQSEGDEDNGGFGVSATGLEDPDSGALYVTGLYAREGAIMCKRPGLRRSPQGA